MHMRGTCLGEVEESVFRRILFGRSITAHKPARRYPVTSERERGTAKGGSTHRGPRDARRIQGDSVMQVSMSLLSAVLVMYRDAFPKPRWAEQGRTELTRRLVYQAKLQRTHIGQ